MADTTNDPRDIEADLEQVRSGLASDLDELSNRASIDYVAREALGMLKLNTTDATRTIDRAMRDNPVAFGLIGLGLAWMVMGAIKALTQPNLRMVALTDYTVTIPTPTGTETSAGFAPKRWTHCRV
ncbi:hypothetical protein HYN69_18575 (plasmid) [Gemmobacter aquarius]|uniref:DUF3618 domain-containing protein n=1 Tax=Paragemmobacter aquarius TaxID=2169400 RepID=A0A2S0US27_9RHOB|nr:DUF3618 domain-containing protein [Gemmobacter aquarius]AWB50607.1 hypothetical protein HYN69_18575 [Gemmobacter aquarius]